MNLAAIVTAAARQVQSLIGSADVVYSNGVGTVANLRAGLGHSEFEITTEQQLITTWRPRDFLIVCADLVISGQRVIPARGHTLTLTLDGVTEIYTVTHADPQQPPWRYADPLNTTFRIHTNRTGVA